MNTYDIIGVCFGIIGLICTVAAFIGVVINNACRGGKRFFTIIALLVVLAACTKTEIVPELGRGRVIKIYPKENSNMCVYELEPITPYLPPSKYEFTETCGRYILGDTVKI